MNASDFLVKRLSEWGFSQVYGYPGDGINGIVGAIDRAGDESAQLQVALGDTVPGYGRVKAVVQQGTTWVVKTERGTIGQ